MNVLRSSPLRPLVFASLLQVLIFCCCGVSSFFCSAVPEELRQVFMNALRSSPLSCFDVASVLQVFIFSCCAVAL